jgi:hypothetical protein
LNQERSFAKPLPHFLWRSLRLTAAFNSSTEN